MQCLKSPLWKKRYRKIKDKVSIANKIQVIDAKISSLITNTRASEKSKVINDILTNPKAFFTYANSFRKYKSPIGPLKSGLTYESGPHQMAQILNAQYKSVFTTPKEDTSQIKLKQYLHAPLSTIDITAEKILKAISQISSFSAPGPDGIPAQFYEDYALSLITPIKIIWEHSLRTGKLPEGTALAMVNPLDKGGDRTDPANFRPIALTNHLTKIFERILKSELVTFLEANNLMNPTQHGFRSGRSTITQLLSYLDNVITSLEEGNQVDAIYLDFAKAFDKVDHDILLLKLKRLNITGDILSWISSFLKRREQIVKIDNIFSKPTPILSGVPQGSVLGPLLFLILMIDIDEHILDSLLGSFADDTKLWKAIKSLLQNHQLQEDLEHVYHWSVLNNMFFNEDKFVHIHFSADHNPPVYLKPSKSPIPTKSCTKDLGVIIQNDLKFNHHIIQLVAKANKVSG